MRSGRSVGTDRSRIVAVRSWVSCAGELQPNSKLAHATAASANASATQPTAVRPRARAAYSLDCSIDDSPRAHRIHEDASRSSDIVVARHGKPPIFTNG